ncbi:hypothetical protein [Halorubellus sp. PRR65]|uniref:hypothetical protein n=1 Tax=Halorubellus sp. PRR65 TaxID=3098148 RepID=UPI002B2622F7|nr:hypothetical protein [Halorubellus sp. PRR65]
MKNSNSNPIEGTVRNRAGVRTVNHYVKFVRDEVDGREWENRRYIANDEDPVAALVDHLPDATEVAA